MRITARQDVERLVRVVLEVDGLAPVLVRVPVGCDEVGDEDTADLIAVLVAFDRVANLACPEDAFGILIGAVEPGIDGHLAELVSGADAEARMVCLKGFDKDFRDRQTSFVRS